MTINTVSVIINAMRYTISIQHKEALPPLKVRQAESILAKQNFVVDYVVMSDYRTLLVMGSESIVFGTDIVKIALSIAEAGIDTSKMDVYMSAPIYA